MTTPVRSNSHTYADTLASSVQKTKFCCPPYSRTLAKRTFGMYVGKRLKLPSMEHAPGNLKILKANLDPCAHGTFEHKGWIEVLSSGQDKCAPIEPDKTKYMRIHLHRARRSWRLIDVTKSKKSFLQARSGRYTSCAAGRRIPEQIFTKLTTPQRRAGRYVRC